MKVTNIIYINTTYLKIFVYSCILRVHSIIINELVPFKCFCFINCFIIKTGIHLKRNKYVLNFQGFHSNQLNCKKFKASLFVKEIVKFCIFTSKQV